MRKKLRDLPFGLYEKSICTTWSWEDKFSLVKEAGYDYFEIAIDATSQKLERLDSREEQLKIRRASEQKDMPLYTFAFTANRFYPLGSEDSQVRKEGIRLLKSAMDFAAFVGARVIQFASYDEYEKPRNMTTEAYFLQSLEECVEHAAQRGTVLALETMDSDFMDTTQKAMRYVRMFDTCYLGLDVDPGNITAMGNDPVSDMAFGTKHIAEVEWKDVMPGDVRNTFFGEGIVDFDACFKALHDIGYQGFMAAEMWANDDPSNHHKIFEAITFLKDKMKEY